MSERKQASNRIELPDKFYNVIGRFANTDWLQFARSANGLGLLDSEIDDIKHDHEHDIRERKYQMLKLWQQKNVDLANVEYLDNVVKNFCTKNMQSDQEEDDGTKSSPHFSHNEKSLSQDMEQSTYNECGKRSNILQDETDIMRNVQQEISQPPTFTASVDREFTSRTVAQFFMESLKVLRRLFVPGRNRICRLVFHCYSCSLETTAVVLLLLYFVYCYLQ